MVDADRIGLCDVRHGSKHGRDLLLEGGALATRIDGCHFEVRWLTVGEIVDIVFFLRLLLARAMLALLTTVITILIAHPPGHLGRPGLLPALMQLVPQLGGE